MEAGRRVTRSAKDAVREKEPSVLTSAELNETFKGPREDIYNIFRAYNKVFFDNVIKGFEIRWMPQLVRYAGKTVPKNRRISLSTKLHIGRSTKMMIETLLREMIHAYLFYIHCPDPSPDGKEFQRLMKRINREGGFAIIISDEERFKDIRHLQRIWQCSECDKQMVRLTARHPANDFTAKLHSQHCAGDWFLIESKADIVKKK